MNSSYFSFLWVPSMTRFIAISALTLAAAGCAASTPAAAPPAVTAPPPARPAPAPPADPLATPPPAGIASDMKFPSISHSRLENGLELRVVTRRTQPIIELRLVLFSGIASDGNEPGVAAVAGELLKVGGAGKWTGPELLARAEALGASLDVMTDRDATRITMAVTTADLDAALDLIGAVAQQPRFAPIEFDKLKQRELERVRNAAKGSPGWAASMVLYRELFDLPTAVHPYAHYDTMPSELSKLTLAGCRRWYQTNVTPENATLVIAGDIDAETAESATKRVFARWKGAKPSGPTYHSPVPPENRTVWLVNRPHSAQSQIYVAGLGPERATPAWPALALTNQILGGGVAGRLFLDVREQRSLAYGTSSSLEEPAHSPVPIVLSAGTQTAKTGLAMQALLENLDKISSAPPTDAEVGMAARYLSDSFLFRTETLGAVADLTAKLAILGLPDDYFDSYRAAVRKLDSADAFEVSQKYFKIKNPVLVVAGDAQVIAKPLSHFGKVVIIDPEHDFQPGQTLPLDPTQPLEAAPAPPVPSPPAQTAPAPAAAAAPASSAGATPPTAASGK
ncbi:MAG TPA: pitrilysin family protein [Polyangiaceae bacterium]|nr:pitrilysin family protein [Polyangiaceae bacterium]